MTPPKKTQNILLLLFLTTLLLRDTDSPAPATSGLGMLTTHAETPVVTKTTVRPDLLKALEIVTELGVNIVGENLRVLAVDNVLLSVEEPSGDLVLSRVLDNGDDTLKFFRSELTGALAQVNIGLLADKVGVTTTNTLDSGHGVHYLLLAVNIGVEKTENILKIRLRVGDERHLAGI